MDLILFIVFIAWCLKLLLKLELFRPKYVFLLGFFLYKFVSFLEYFTQNTLGMYGSEITVHLLFSLSLLFGMQIVDFFGARTVVDSSFFKHKSRYNKETFSLTQVKLISSILVTVGLIGYYIMILQAYGGLLPMLAVSSRYELFAERDGLGLLGLGFNIACTGILFRLVYWLMYSKRQIKDLPWIYLIIGTLIVLLQLVMGNRGNMLLLLLPIVLLFCLLYRRMNSILLVSIPIGIFAMQIIGIARALLATDLTVFEYLESTNYEQVTTVSQFGEFLAQQSIDISIWRNYPLMDPFLGKTFLDAVMNFFPSFVFPDRPPLPATWYVQTYFPEIYARGGGMAFSVVAEGIINFGYWGPFTMGFLMAYIFKWLERKSFQNLNVYTVVFLLISLYYCFYITRSGITSLLKPWLFGGILPLFLVKAFVQSFFKGLNEKN
jgi:oligosaccharide repeat unit polymerase